MATQVTPYVGSLPQEGDKATFHSRAQAVFAWLVAMIPELNQALEEFMNQLDGSETVLAALEQCVRKDEHSTFLSGLNVRSETDWVKLRINQGGPADHTPTIMLYQGNTMVGFLQAYSDKVHLGGGSGRGRLDIYGDGDLRMNGHPVLHTGRAHGDVGDIMQASNNSGGVVYYGDIVAGDSLRPSSAGPPSQVDYVPAGSWQCCGYKEGSAIDFWGAHETTVWKRVA